eukprot:5269939-Amphidinium_carterae.2
MNAAVMQTTRQSDTKLHMVQRIFCRWTVDLWLTPGDDEADPAFSLLEDLATIWTEVRKGAPR